MSHGVSGSYSTPPSDFEVMSIIFFNRKLRFFLHEISFAEKIIMSGGVANFFRRHFPPFLNNCWFSIGRDKIIFLKGIWDPKLTYSR